MKRFSRLILAAMAMLLSSVLTSAQTVARVWDEQALAAIRIDLPHPPVHARNLFHLSVAMYDAWAAYDSLAVGYLYRDKHSDANVAAARNQAISYAAYKLLRTRYALSRNAALTLAALDAQMAALGYDTNNAAINTTTPAGVGNAVAATVLGFFLNDGAREADRYQIPSVAEGGYAPVNPPLDVARSGTQLVDPNRWQPLKILNAIAQNGIPVATVQTFLGAQWLEVRPFALARDQSSVPWIDPGPPPLLGGLGDAEYRAETVEVIQRSSQLSPDDGVTIDISPGSFGNNNLGANDGAGYALNPVSGVKYNPNLVRRGDFARILAEFWADGPNSETPPGHWNVIANSVTDHPLLSKRIHGAGPVVDDLQWDVKIYFALNAALHDAACAAWSIKRYYDGWRPIEAIRYLGQRGQSSDPHGASYDPDGLPLIPGLIELVSETTAQPGQRHAGLPSGHVVILAWPGQPADSTNDYSGVHWILPESWMPYQRKTFVTPAFPGYISGHSTFSRAAAEVLAAITGSKFFPTGNFTNPTPNLTFEKGPSRPVRLEWATYYDASDQAGLSRLWGGIHVSADDLTGRRLGAQCGKGAWQLAQQYFDGTLGQDAPRLVIATVDKSHCELRFATQRGLFYRLQSTRDVNLPFADEWAQSVQATESTYSLRAPAVDSQKFYRVITTREP